METLVDCPYGCIKYRKSIEDVTVAGKKHKEKALALKSIAEEQKDEIHKKDKEIDDIKEVSEKMRKSQPNVSLEEELENVRNHFIEAGDECKTLIEQKKIPDCWFGIKCRRMFCNFDHRNIFTLVNKRVPSHEK